MPGRFVTFEGGEGTGKSTQLARLETRLRAEGADPLVTREPGGTPFAEHVRALLLDLALAPVPAAEALLMEAARADLVANVIRPALASGRLVLCDRFDDSTLAYQGAGRGLDPAWLAALNAGATGGLKPDLTFLFDLDPQIGLERRARAGPPEPPGSRAARVPCARARAVPRARARGARALRRHRRRAPARRRGARGVVGT